MNIKEFVMPAIIALSLTIAFQYFFLNKKTEKVAEGVKTGQSFIAPRTMSEARPLNLEVNFSADHYTHEPKKTLVETPYATFVFSEEGASLERLTFKEHVHESPTLIPTISATEQTSREERCFLVALDTVTPYYYYIHSVEPTEKGTELVYEIETQQGLIQKKFLIHNDRHQVDLTVSVNPKGNGDFGLRVIYPSPFMAEIAKDDTYSALVINEQNSLEKIARKKLDAHRGWFAPTAFGAENKYFINAMVADAQHFVRRSYYKIACNSLISILEGPSVAEKTSWTLSFYMGPKTESAIAQVDPRLEGAIEHSGWLAPLSRLLLYLLKLIHSYVHNYGLAIILLTIAMKLMLLPFAHRGKNTRKKQEEYQRKLAYIQQKYKNEPELLARERADLIRKHGVPGLGAMIPMLLQFPLFIALNRVLSSSIEMYKAPFLWIPDLSGYDPYSILAVLITVSMLVNALFTDAKQRLSMLALGLVIGAFAANFSAGLALFILVSTVMTVLQTMMQGKAA